MRTRSLGISLAFHALVFTAAMVSLPWLKRDFVIPPPISVEFVDIAKVTETDKVSPKPAPKKEEEKKAPPQPAPAPQNTAKEATAPVDKPEEKKEEAKKEEKDLTDPNVLPEKKEQKKPPKKEEKKAEKKEKPPEPQRDFSSVLKNLAETKEAPPPAVEQPDLKLDESATAEGQNAPLGAKMTMSEEDALRRQLEGCWNVPFGAKDAENLRVEIFMVINPDRTLRDARVVDTARYNSDSFFRAAADSAMRAVRNPLCSPFALPPDKYETWKTTTVTFDPSQMF